MDSIVIYVGFLFLKKKHSLLFQFTFTQGIFLSMCS